MTSKVEALHNDENTDNVAQLSEGKGLLEDPAAVHAKQTPWNVQTTQVEHTVFYIEPSLDLDDLLLLDTAAHQSLCVDPVLEPVNL
jgi:hypothetical protein